MLFDLIIEDSELCIPNIQLMEAEVALYWRMICRHLQMAAQVSLPVIYLYLYFSICFSAFSVNYLVLVLGQEKGSDAASAMGTEAAVYAAEATDNNDLLERILPATISDYIDLVKSHIVAGG